MATTATGFHDVDGILGIGPWTSPALPRPLSSYSRRAKALCARRSSSPGCRRSYASACRTFKNVLGQAKNSDALNCFVTSSTPCLSSVSIVSSLSVRSTSSRVPQVRAIRPEQASPNQSHLHIHSKPSVPSAAQALLCYVGPRCNEPVVIPHSQDLNIRMERHEHRMLSRLGCVRKSLPLCVSEAKAARCCSHRSVAV